MSTFGVFYPDNFILCQSILFSKGTTSTHSACHFWFYSLIVLHNCFSCRSYFMHLITVVALLQLISASALFFSLPLIMGTRTACSVHGLDTLHLYWHIMMFYMPFLSMSIIINSFLTTSTILLLYSGFLTLLPKLHLCWVFPLHFCLWSGSWQLLLLHQNFLFLSLLPFYASTISERASFLQGSYPPWSLNFYRRFILQSPSKASALFTPYLVYQHCQATFYYAGNSKCLQDVCQAHRM